MVYGLSWASQVVLVAKSPPASAGDLRERFGFDPWVRKIPWRRVQQPPYQEYSCQESPVEAGAWGAMVRKVTKSQTQLK